MNRATIRFARAVASVSIVASLIAGCELLGLGPDPITIPQRIQQLEEELNKPVRSGTYLLFHPTQTTDYQAIKPAAFWDTPFPIRGAGEAAYDIRTVSQTPEAAPQAVLIKISGPVASFGGGPFDYRLDMAQDADDNWMIRGLDRWNLTDQIWDPVVE